MRDRTRTRTALVLAAGSFVAATAIYLVTRDGLRLHEWLASAVWVPEWDRSRVPDFVRFNLPDALWQYAFCVTVFAIWRRARRSAIAIACISLPVLVGVGTELLQLLGLIEGVFDPIDVVGMLAAALVALVTIGLPRSAKTHPTPRTSGLTFGVSRHPERASGRVRTRG